MGGPIIQHCDKSKPISPFLKWAGGKRQIMRAILKRVPRQFSTYYEPFVGGGAVLFTLLPENAVLNDFNAELINVYTVIRDNIAALIEDLGRHKNDPAYFYEIRNQDRTEKFFQLTDVERASRVIFLNKTCYNGLYRVNRSGKFNTPFGKYKNPAIVNAATLQAAHDYLNAGNITISTGDYETVLQGISPDSFVYFDPPYHPLSASSSFTQYVGGGWEMKDQERLKTVCDRLHSDGVRFLLSNSSSAAIKNLYKHYRIESISATRAINANSRKRGPVKEVLIRNYD